MKTKPTTVHLHLPNHLDTTRCGLRVGKTGVDLKNANHDLNKVTCRQCVKLLSRDADKLMDRGEVTARVRELLLNQ